MMPSSPSPEKPCTRKWNRIAAGTLLALLLGGLGWWMEYLDGPEDRQITRSINALHFCGCGIHDNFVRSLHHINTRSYRTDREDLNSALAGVLSAPMKTDIPTQTFLAEWLCGKGADPSSFPILNWPLPAELLEWCLQNGANPNMQDSRGNTALHGRWDGKELERLLNAGADVSIRNKEGWTPLREAVAQDRPEAVKILLEHGADVHDCGKSLGYMIVHSHYDLVSALLEHGLDVNWKEENGRNALHHAVIFGTTIKRVRLLLHHKIDVNALDRWGNTPLDHAEHLRKNAPDIYQALLEAGAKTSGQLKAGS